MAVVSLQDAAYAAGFFDGEGCISIALQLSTTSRGKRYYGRRYFLNINISQNDPMPLRWLAERFGGSVHFKRGKRSYDRGYYERWDWHITTQKALNFLRIIRPFLIVKAEQADIAFEFAETIVRDRKKTPEGVQLLRAQLRDRLKETRENAFKNA